MIQKLKRKCRPTIVLMIAGFAVSFTSVMTGISTINALLEELSKADGETPIYWTMQNTGLSEQTGEVYEVAGYFAKGSKWVDENDLIRFPLDSLDGRCIAPWSEKSKSDIMLQLSGLHNTYIMLEEDADTEWLKQQIHDYSVQHGFETSADTLAEEYEEYRVETMAFTKRNIGLAVFLSAMAVSFVIAVFTTNVLLKRKQYGVFIANGFSLKDVASCIAVEISIIISCSILLAWGAKLAEFLAGKDLFRDMLLTAHIRFTLPICLAIGVLLVIMATVIPAIQIFQYQPCELTGGDTNGNY